MYEIDKDKIITDMQHIKSYLNFIENENITNITELEGPENMKEYMALSFAIFNILNKMIELGEEIIDSLEKDLYPKTYKEIPQILFSEKIINKDQFKIFIQLIEYRNEIAHEYDNITIPEIFWCLQKIDFVNEFLRIVKARLL